MVLLHLLNCTHFNAFFCIHDIKYKQKSKVHEIPAWARKVLDIRNPESKWVQFWSTSIAREAYNTRGPKLEPLGRLCGNSIICKLEKFVGGGEGKKKYPTRQCNMCAAHKKRNETRYLCKSARFRYTKGLVLRNIIQWRTTGLCTRWLKYDRDWLCVNKPQSVPVIFEPPWPCNFCSLRLRSIIYSVKP